MFTEQTSERREFLPRSQKNRPNNSPPYAVDWIGVHSPLRSSCVLSANGYAAVTLAPSKGRLAVLWNAANPYSALVFRAFMSILRPKALASVASASPG
jgi:hypothetical protein